MSSITKNILSGSTNGRQIAVAATATLGTAIHTATATSGQLDELYLYANNIDGASAHTITIEFGGTSAADHKVIQLPVGAGDTLVVAGLPLTGGVAVTIFADAANVVNISGYVNTLVQP